MQLNRNINLIKAKIPQSHVVFIPEDDCEQTDAAYDIRVNGMEYSIQIAHYCAPTPYGVNSYGKDWMKQHGEFKTFISAVEKLAEVVGGAH